MERDLYLRVEKATWVIHAKLGPGVFPLVPKIKGWILNSTSQAKIQRKGFTFLPDYASTAFMIQGATLCAGLADCGDVLEAVGSSDAMTSYVILSRLTSADGLLFLRAFSPYLFTMGTDAGPSCLLEHLRRRFQQGNNSPSVEEARAEYDRNKRNKNYSGRSVSRTDHCFNVGIADLICQQKVLERTAENQMKYILNVWSQEVGWNALFVNRH